MAEPRKCFSLVTETFCVQVEKMKEIAKIKAKEERKRLESEVRIGGMHFTSSFIIS